MDVYDDSPTKVTNWLTIMPKISIIIFLLELELGIAYHLELIKDINSVFSNPIREGFEFFLISFQSLPFLPYGSGGVVGIKNIFLLSSLLSLIIGTIVGLAQTRIKRLLA